MWYGLIGLGVYAAAKALEEPLEKLDRTLAERRRAKAEAQAAEQGARQQLAAICATDIALELERKRLEVEKLTLEVEAAKRRLEG